MKARIKATGEIVKLAEYAKITLDMCDSYGNPIELKPEDVELIYDEEVNFPMIDWNQVRVQASIGIGDEVWFNTSQGIVNGTIEEITITRYGVLCEVSSEQILDIQWPIDKLYSTKEELLKSI